MTAAFLSATAAVPTAVWDSAASGKGLNTTQGGYSISKGDINTFSNGRLVINSTDSSFGAYIKMPDSTTKASILLKYSNGAAFSGSSYDLIWLAAATDSYGHEIGISSTNNSETLDFCYRESGVNHPKTGPAMIPDSGYMLFSYGAADGIGFYSGTSIPGMTGAKDTAYKFSSYTITYISIGGDKNHYPGWRGLVIEKAALFVGQSLSATDVSGFRFPSEVFDQNTNVSDVNATFGTDSEITLQVGNGVTITGDTTFNASTVNFVCDGSFSLVPPADNAADFDFSNVLGAPTIKYTGAIPSISGDKFTATIVPTSVSGDSWRGIIKVSSIPRQWPLPSLYSYSGANSAVEIDGIGAKNGNNQSGEYIQGVQLGASGNKFVKKLILSGAGMALTDGLSQNCIEIGELSGSGPLSQSKDSILQGIAINVMTNFTGTLSPNKMTVTFGSTKRCGQKNGTGGWSRDPDTAEKLFIDSDAVLSVRAPFSLWSPAAVVVDGPVNFTTDATDYTGLVLFTNAGTNGSFGENAVIKINGTAIGGPASQYRAKFVGTSLVVKKIAPGVIFR